MSGTPNCGLIHDLVGVLSREKDLGPLNLHRALREDLERELTCWSEYLETIDPTKKQGYSQTPV